MAPDRPTRTERLLALLLSCKGRRIPLYEVQRVAGAQHGARIAEARRLGYVIDNVMEHTPEGVHSWYILRSTPDEAPKSLFGDLSPESSYPE